MVYGPKKTRVENWSFRVKSPNNQKKDMKLQHIYFCGSVDAVAYFKNQSELTQTARKLRAVFYYAAYFKA